MFALAAYADEEERPDAFPRGEETCFGRVYDDEHLKAHPDQTVTSFYLWHEFSADPLREWGEETSAEKRAGTTILTTRSSST